MTGFAYVLYIMYGPNEESKYESMYAYNIIE